MLKDPISEQIAVHEKLKFFVLKSNVISHQWYSRIANTALFYVCDYSHYVYMRLLIRIIGLTWRIIGTLGKIIGIIFKNCRIG